MRKTNEISLKDLEGPVRLGVVVRNNDLSYKIKEAENNFELGYKEAREEIIEMIEKEREMCIKYPLSYTNEYKHTQEQVNLHIDNTYQKILEKLK